MFVFRITLLGPDPPTNLSINVRHGSGKPVHLTWDPPLRGGYSKYKLRLSPLSEGPQLGQPRNFIQDEPPFILRDLVPGASYDAQLYTLFENKESTAFESGNFTISKSSINYLSILNPRFSFHYFHSGFSMIPTSLFCRTKHSRPFHCLVPK